MRSVRALPLRSLLLILACLSQFAGCQGKPEPPPSPQRRIANPPNFVIILGQDLGYGDVGCNGQKKIFTPNLDRLAHEGVRLTEFYAGDPLGQTTPWCLMSGRDASAADRKAPPHRAVLRPEMATLAEVLQRAGYRTAFAGCWSLGGGDKANLPGVHGFQDWAVLPTDLEAAPAFPPVLWKKNGPTPVKANAKGQQAEYVSDVLMREALALIGESPTPSPFLLVIECPALPTDAPLPTRELYADKDWLDSQKTYAARISEFDRGVGLIMEGLQRLRLANRTAMIVTSTCGPRPPEPDDLEFFTHARQVSGGNLAYALEAERGANFFHSTGGLRGGKGQLYEGGIRVPFIARLPGAFMPGIARDYPAAIWDVMPTLTELSGAIAVPKKLDGRSIAPMLRGGIGDARDMLYWDVYHGTLGQAVRIGDWKVIRPPGKTRTADCELYNVRKDPAEKKNQAQQHPEIVARFLK